MAPRTLGSPKDVAEVPLGQDLRSMNLSRISFVVGIQFCRAQCSMLLWLVDDIIDGVMQRSKSMCISNKG